MSPTRVKVLKDGTFVGGFHMHHFGSREDGVTSEGGAHEHWFLIDGDFHFTSFDGAHRHSMNVGSTETGSGEASNHQHFITVRGESLFTETDGGHSHALSLFSTIVDGGHEHLLQYAGATHVSLTPLEIEAEFRRQETQFEAEFQEVDEVAKASSYPAKAPRKEKKKQSGLKKVSKVQTQFPNEHRFAISGAPFESYRRTHDAAMPEGVDLVSGVVEKKATIVEVVFDAQLWGMDKAQDWLVKSEITALRSSSPPSLEERYKGASSTTAAVKLVIGKSQVALVLQPEDPSFSPWLLAVSRVSAEGVQAEDLEKSFSLFGSRYYRALASSNGVVAKQAGCHGGTEKVLGHVKLERGVTDQNRQELFLSGGTTPLGGSILVMKRSRDPANREFWIASMEKRAPIPLVLQRGAAIELPEGVHALPTSIAKYFAEGSRYWQDGSCPQDLPLEDYSFVGTDKRELRVVKSVVTPTAVKRIEVREKTGVDQQLDSLFDLPAGSLRVRPTVAHGLSLESVLEKMGGRQGDYLVEWPSGTDGELLQKLGSPFKLEGSSNVFVCSRPFRSLRGVSLVEKQFEHGFTVMEPGVESEELKLYRRVLTKKLDLLQKEATDHFVLGPVLVPDTFDLQGDRIDAAEIRKTAHRFMEFHRQLGLDHEEMVHEDLVILENQIMLADVVVKDFAGQSRTITRDTWLLGVGIRSEPIWNRIQKGTLRGFSMGGSGLRMPIG